jgi:hypothetical protein
MRPFGAVEKFNNWALKPWTCAVCGQRTRSTSIIVHDVRSEFRIPATSPVPDGIAPKDCHRTEYDALLKGVTEPVIGIPGRFPGRLRVCNSCRDISERLKREDREDDERHLKKVRGRGGGEVSEL